MTSERPRKRLLGVERFHESGADLPLTVQSFWIWSASNLMGNTLRGWLAEYLVAVALGLGNDVREEWSGHDLQLEDGLRIEVKSSAYLQSWSQRALSKIQFDIGPKLAWDATTNTYAAVPTRSAQVYVFALLRHQHRNTADPLDLSQWEFYVVPTFKLSALGAQKTLALSGVQRLAGGAVRFADLRSTIAGLRLAVEQGAG